MNFKIVRKQTGEKQIETYLLQNDVAQLGYATVDFNAKDNNIYVFINPEHRSNGYGSYLFAEMVKMFKQKNVQDLKFNIEKNNTNAINIIVKNNGKLLLEDRQAHLVLKIS